MGGSRGSGRSRSKGKAAKLDARAVEALLHDAEHLDDDVLVVAGGEEALRRLVTDRILGQPGAAAATRVRVRASDPGAAETVRHASEPTLFGGATWLVVSDLEQGGDELFAAVKECLSAAGPDLRLVLAHGGAPRGRGVLNAAQQQGARTLEVRAVAANAVPGVLTGHARTLGCVLTSDAAASLIDGMGQDLTALLAAVGQLASDTEDGRITADLVHQTLIDSGSQNQFEIADLVWRQRSEEALVAFRQLAERNGASSACVTVIAALSYSLRTLARYVAERPSGKPWQQAAALGVPVWKMDTLASQAKLWRPGRLAEAAVLLAEADADAKGGLGDAGALDLEQKLYAVERLILRLGRQPAGVS